METEPKYTLEQLDALIAKIYIAKCETCKHLFTHKVIRWVDRCGKTGINIPFEGFFCAHHEPKPE